MTSTESIAPPEEDELLVVVGPTASGKTDLAIELAELHRGEIVGADSVQIYRHFDAGSGKPTADERARVRHHLVDSLDPLDHLDAAGFVARADDAIAEIRARGRTPIVCGGSFLWVKALLSGLAQLPPGDRATREQHARLVERSGRAALHAELAKVDPASAERIAPNDFVRVSRALEVFELSGKPQSAWHAEHGFRQVRHRHRLIGILRERAELDRRIAERTRGWLAAGWLDEVRSLRERGYRDARAMGSVGYKQVALHLDGRLEANELAEAITRATRVFVRRQRTWLREEPVTWISGR